MKIRLFVLCLLLCCAVFAADETRKGWLKGPDKSWYIDYDLALEAAKAQNKKVYVLRTGSDWCGFCIRLKKEVFASREFKQYAKKNLILVYLDFPKRKKMPAEQKQYNNEISTKLKFGGAVPSAVILDSDGKEIGRVRGYAKLKIYMTRLQDAVGK